jgi:hypothetical protein
MLDTLREPEVEGAQKHHKGSERSNPPVLDRWPEREPGTLIRLIPVLDWPIFESPPGARGDGER